MTDISPFDHRQDTELGSLLREALTPAGENEFVERVKASAAAEGLLGEVDWWEVLGSWSKPGLIAAALGFLVLSLWHFGPLTGKTDPVEEALRADSASEAPSWITAPMPPAEEQVLAALLENETGR